MNNNINNKNKFWALLFPLLLENLFIRLVGLVDVGMVSAVGDDAVAAVGAADTYLETFVMLLYIMGVGVQAVMSQYIGAGRQDVAKKARNIGLGINAAVGLLLGSFFAVFSRDFLSLIGTEAAIIEDAAVYMRLVGGSFIFLAVNCIFSAYLRSFGRPKITFLSASAGNAVNVALNAVFISLGYGTLGVALATFISRALSLCVSFVFVLGIRPCRTPGDEIPAKKLTADIIKIGLPAAGESFWWSLCISLVMVFINQMGTEGVATATYAYCTQIGNVISVMAISLNSAVSIMVGWHVGAHKFAAADALVKKAALIGPFVSAVLTLILVFLARPIVSCLTDSEAILANVIPIMLLEIPREYSKCGNNIVGGALKSTGDALSTFVIGLFIMPLSALFGSYFLGIVCHMGIVGAWIGLATDEGLRFLCMFLRWNSRKWEKKVLIK